MTLYDDFRDLTYDQIGKDPAGKAYLDGGEAAIIDGDFGVPDMLRVLSLTIGVHREQILRLAEEIDALKSAP